MDYQIHPSTQGHIDFISFWIRNVVSVFRENDQHVNGVCVCKRLGGDSWGNSLNKSSHQNIRFLILVRDFPQDLQECRNLWLQVQCILHHSSRAAN